MPTLDKLNIAQPQIGTALLQGMGMKDRMDRTAIAQDRTEIAREGQALSREAFEWNKKQKMFALSRDFIPTLEREEWPKYKGWLEGIHPELARMLPEDVDDMPDDKWDELKTKLQIGTDNASALNREEFKAWQAEKMEIQKQANKMEIKRQEASAQMGLAKQKAKDAMALQDDKQAFEREHGKKNIDKTAMSRWLRDNPNATEAEIIAFSGKLKSKGLRVTTNPDGTTTVEMGGPQIGVATKNKIEKEIVDMSSELFELTEVDASAFEEILTYQGKLKEFGLDIADKAGIDVGEANKDFLSKSRVMVENLEQFFNKYRKRITGAQAAMKEITMLRESILNKKIGPTQFRASLDNIFKKVKLGIRQRRMMLNRGVQDEAVLTDLYNAGTEVPDEEMDRRGDELLASGMDEMTVIEQLRKEGYPIDEEVDNAK